MDRQAHWVARIHLAATALLFSCGVSCAWGQTDSLAELFAKANQRLAVFETSPVLTLAQTGEARALQAALKAAIEALPEARWDDWQDAFGAYLERADRIVASKPLLVPVSAAYSLLVRSPADLLLRLTQRYKIMDESAGQVDFTRFAGVDADDVAGVEMLAEYYERRTLGKSLSVPGFNLMSPYGVLQFLNRLVRKYAHEAISERQGQHDVVHDDFLRYVDGTKPAYDGMVQRVRETLVALSPDVGPLSPDVGPLSPDPEPLSPDLEPLSLRLDRVLALLDEFGRLNRALLADVDAALAAFEGEEEFEVQLRREITAALNGELGPGVPGYGPRWRSFQSLLWHSPFLHSIDGVEVYLPESVVDTLTNRLPATVTQLLRYPGISQLLDRDSFRPFISAGAYAALRSVDALGQIPPLVDLTLGDGVDEEGAALAFPARRFQLLALLLDAWQDDLLLPGGGVNVDAFWANLVLNDQLEALLDEAELLIEKKRVELHAFRTRPLSQDNYAATKEILIAAREQLAELLEPALSDAIGDVWSEVTSRTDARFRKLASEFREIAATTLARVGFDSGEELVFDPRRIQAGALEPLLGALSLRESSGHYHREAYLRLNGIDEHVLGGLVSQYNLDALLSFSFHPLPMPVASPAIFAEAEILFSLTPRLVGRFGTADPVELGHHLASGVPMPVQPGVSLEGTVKGIVRHECQRARDALAAISPSSLAGLLAARRRFRELGETLRARLAPVAEALSARDVGTLESWINWRWDEPGNVRAVRELFDHMVSGTSYLRQGYVLIPVRDVLQIPRFPWTRDYDRELFVGLTPQDFAEAEALTEADAYRYFHFGPMVPAREGVLSAFGRVQVAVNAIGRLLRAALSGNGGSEELLSVFFLRNGIRHVDVEQLRLYLKGVRAMIARIEAETLALVEEAKEELVEQRSASYTIAEIMDQHEEIVLGTRRTLLELLMEKTEKHERRDVIMAESPVSQLFQSRVFDVLGENVTAGELVVEHGGVLVAVPVEAITLSLLSHLRERVGGPIAAHHFALLPGISLRLVRELHKLEDYMGEQVIALPRTSEYVRITSRISELGYMQLASHIVNTFADNLINADTSTVALEHLIDLLSDEGMAREQLYQELAAIRDRVLAELAETATELNPDSLAALQELLDDAKIKLAGLATDFVSGLDMESAALEELAGELETYINALYGEIKDERDRLLSSTPLTYSVHIGGAAHVIECPLDDSTVGRFIAFADGIAGTGQGNEPVSVGNSQPVCTDAFCFPSSSAGRLGMPVWSPVPPVFYDPTHHPTRFGMTLIFARLLVRYGEFVVDDAEDDGWSVSMDAFEEELGRDDADRARRRLVAIREREIPAVEALIESLRAEDGSFPVAALGEVTERLFNIRERMETLSEDAFEEAREVWNAFVGVYESSLFDTVLNVETERGSARFDGRVLDEVLMRAYHSGRIDVTRLLPFIEMIEEGETVWEYDRFRHLPCPYWGGWWEGVAFPTHEADEEAFVDAGAGGIGTAAGSFTLGDLATLPGITGQDLNGVDVAERDWLVVTPGDAERLLGLLNIRTIAPGSGVDAGGWLDGAKADAPDYAVNETADTVLQLREAFALEEKSYRFRAFELIPALIREAGAGILDEEGVVIASEFAAYLAGDATTGTAEQDLLPLEEGADVAVVDCTASPDDPVLLELCRKTAMQVAATYPTFAHVHAFPWRSRMSGIEQLFSGNGDFDIVLDIAFLELPEDQDDLFAELRELFVAEWFAVDIVRLAPRPMWLSVPSRKRLPGRESLVLGIALAETEALHSYWRVTAPVARFIGEDVIVDSDLASGASVRIGDLVPDPDGGDDVVDDARPETGLGGTQVVVLFRNRGLAAGDGDDGAAASHEDGLESIDVISVRPGDVRVAVGFLPIPNIAAEPHAEDQTAPVRIEVIADPDNIVIETNEENNTLILTEARIPVPCGRFRARAFHVRSEEGVRDSLAVVARLACLGHRALEITFPTALQMDIEIADNYLWSAGLVFAQVETRIVVVPGKYHEWRTVIPLADFGGQVDAPLSIRAFLVGTAYEAIAEVLFRPVPPHFDDPSELDRFFKPSSEEDEGGWIGDLILGDPDDSITIGVAGGGGSPADLTLLHIADGAAVKVTGGGLAIAPGDSFLGQAYIAFDVVREEGGSAEARSVRVGPQAFTLYVRSGWNLVSLPIVPFEPLNDLLARVSAADAWYWRDGGGYERAEMVELGVGFWLYCQDDGELTFLGDPARRDRVDLAPGWHLLGTVNDRPVPSDAGVGAVFEWRNRLYTQAPDMCNGKAYWFFVTEASHLELD